MSGVRGWAAVAALCLAGTACRSAPELVDPPPASARTAFGWVRADDPDEAADLARTVDATAHRLLDAWPGMVSRPFDVWLQSVLQLYEQPLPERTMAAGSVHEGIILVRRTDLGHRPQSLAHELVHLLRDETWDGLLPALEEGLCEAFALEQPGPHRSTLIGTRAIAVLRSLDTFVVEVGPVRDGEFRPETRSLPIVGDVDVDRLLREWTGEEGGGAREAADGSWAERRWEEARGFALFAVLAALERRGIEGLHALSREAAARGTHVPVATVLASAGLASDRDWREAVGRACDAQAQRVVIESSPQAVAQIIAENIGGRSGRGVPADQPALAGLHLRLPGARAALPLSGFPEVLAELAAPRAAAGR